MIHCTNCGFKMGSLAIYCSACGTRAPETVLPSKDEEERKENPLFHHINSEEVVKEMSHQLISRLSPSNYCSFCGKEL